LSAAASGAAVAVIWTSAAWSSADGPPELLVRAAVIEGSFLGDLDLARSGGGDERRSTFADLVRIWLDCLDVCKVFAAPPSRVASGLDNDKARFIIG
jgi:hypothetical protein